MVNDGNRILKQDVFPKPSPGFPNLVLPQDSISAFWRPTHLSLGVRLVRCVEATKVHSWHHIDHENYQSSWKWIWITGFNGIVKRACWTWNLWYWRDCQKGPKLLHVSLRCFGANIGMENAPGDDLWFCRENVTKWWPVESQMTRFSQTSERWQQRFFSTISASEAAWFVIEVPSAQESLYSIRSLPRSGRLCAFGG